MAHHGPSDFATGSQAKKWTFSEASLREIRELASSLAVEQVTHLEDLRSAGSPTPGSRLIPRCLPLRDPSMRKRPRDGVSPAPPLALLTAQGGGSQEIDQLSPLLTLLRATLLKT